MAIDVRGDAVIGSMTCLHRSGSMRRAGHRGSRQPPPRPLGMAQAERHRPMLNTAYRMTNPDRSS